MKNKGIKVTKTKVNPRSQENMLKYGNVSGTLPPSKINMGKLGDKLIEIEENKEEQFSDDQIDQE